MSVGMMLSLLTSDESNGSFLTSSSPTNATFQLSFPSLHVPDVNFSQANEVPMTSLIPTFMNGAYSHESKQLGLLQERAKLLEGQVMKLSIENTTLKMAFQCLAGAVGLCDLDPSQVDGTAFLQASTSPKPKLEPAPATPTNYLLVRFWDREDWDKYLESPEGQTSKRGTMGFLEDKDSNPPSREMAKAIRKLLRGGWVELVYKDLAPLSWGKLSASARQFIHNLMESSFPDFKLANNGWKLDYLASTTYPAWRKGTLDDNRKWKPKKGKGLKTEDDDNDNEDDSMDEVGMKRKALVIKSEAGPGKRLKVSARGAYSGRRPDTVPLNSFSLPPRSSTPVPSFESSDGTADDSESPSSSDVPCDMQRDPDGVTSSVISIDPLAVLALAASKARGTPPIPALDHPQESSSSSSGSIETPLKATPNLELEHAILLAAMSVSPSMPATVNNSVGASASKSTKGGGKAKMQPGPAKNGRNLCAHRWRKQVQSSGSMEEFQNYYNGLTSVQRIMMQAYDNEAIALAASNTWDTKIICNGALH
ncbi:hypothetical protein EDD15DRAFT_2421529 [Pisolithus albus]|nr:hypothetical protein EDD15DRAFT_2421529 [Pisolithus albus]